MGRAADKKKCNMATKQKLNNINSLLEKKRHDTCSTEGRGLNQEIVGERLNRYIDAVNKNNVDIPSHYRFAHKPQTVCANMERIIKGTLEQYDMEQNRLEEEFFANRQRYNLRSNGENIIEEEIWVDNRFNAIEEEAIIEEAIDGDLPGGNDNNNNNNNPPAIVDHRNLPRTSKFIKLSELVQERSKQFKKRYRFLKHRQRSDRAKDLLASVLAMCVDKKAIIRRS